MFIVHMFIVEELDNASNIHVFKRLEEEGHAEHFQCQVSLVDLLHYALYALHTHTIQN